jgi:hypothetical protein
VANRVETKVVAAAGGSGAGATVATFTLWLLGVLAWHVPNSADRAGDAIAAVPSPVAGLILVVVSALGAALGGWLAPHTHLPAEPVMPGVIVVPAEAVGDVRYARSLDDLPKSPAAQIAWGQEQIRRAAGHPGTEPVTEMPKVPDAPASGGLTPPVTLT